MAFFYLTLLETSEKEEEDEIPNDLLHIDRVKSKQYRDLVGHGKSDGIVELQRVKISILAKC